MDVPYYPSYQGITPKARLKYLKWLTDITQPVDIGFVFIFYYGLERHLFAGRHEEAAEMILKLREYHKNSSFQSYSEDALTIYAVKRRRIDIANRIGIIEFGKKAIIAAATHGRIEPYDIIMNARKFGFTNTRYIKMYPELFEETLARGLQEKYGSPAMHIDQDDIMGSPRTGVMVLANYSLQSKNKMINYPNILENENFKTDVLSALLNTHEQVKDELARRRKGAVKQED